MRHSVKTFIFLWLIIIGVGVFGFCLGQQTNWSARLQTMNVHEVINGDTDLIESLALAAKTQSDNADIILQIFNALNGDPVKDLPKSINGLLMSDKPELELDGEDEQVPATFEQITKDQREINLGIRSLVTGNLFQADALHTILTKVELGDQQGGE